MGEVAPRVVPFKADALHNGAAKVPHSVAAEQALLGAILVNNRIFDDLEGRLTHEHFYVPLHAAMFEAMDAIINGRGGEANPITVKERLAGTSFGDEKTLFSTLTALFESASLSTNAKSLAEVITTAYRQRQLIGLGQSLADHARNAANTEAVEAVLESAGSELFRLAEVGTAARTSLGLREGLVDVVRMAEAARQSGSGVTGVASGFVDLDMLLGGFQPGDFIVLGARPSMGKTSLLLNIAQHAAERHANGLANSGPVGIFSLEMSKAQLIQRIVSNAARVSTQQMTNGLMSAEDMNRVIAAAEALQSLPLAIDDTPALTIGALRARARRMKREFGIKLLVVDYLQLMSAPVRWDANRVQEITQISQGLKHVARELDIPVIAASQLSRQVEQRDNKRPLLSDLRESGSIEQDADVVLMLYREDYYISRALGAANDNDAANEADRKKVAEARMRLDEVQGVTELLVPKNRKGPTSAIKLMFDGETTTFGAFSGRASYAA